MNKIPKMIGEYYKHIFPEHKPILNDFMKKAYVGGLCWHFAYQMHKVFPESKIVAVGRLLVGHPEFKETVIESQTKFITGHYVVQIDDKYYDAYGEYDISEYLTKELMDVDPDKFYIEDLCVYHVLTEEQIEIRKEIACLRVHEQLCRFYTNVRKET